MIIHAGGSSSSFCFSNLIIQCPAAKMRPPVSEKYELANSRSCSKKLTVQWAVRCPNQKMYVESQACTNFKPPTQQIL